jgi:PadR family transcriptional regulator AphA
MARKQRTKYAILGLLSWKPMSGYDINKMVEVALSHFWSESYGQLFPTLGRLVEEGLATRAVDRGSGARERTVYTITAKGRREFDAWMREAADPPRVRNELQLKFFLTSRRSIDESVRLLEEYRAQQEERLRDYKESETILARAIRDRSLPEELQGVLGSRDRRGNPAPNELLIFHLTLRHGILAVEARLEWIEESLAALGAARTQGRN